MNPDEMSMLDLVTDALATDGSHHKQWYLQLLLIKLVGIEEAERLIDEYEWEDGIPA